MFFPNLMNIKPGDLVLEIGPGAYPFWRADCAADKFDPADESVDLKQFGGKKMKAGNKPLFKIVDNKLPFKDKSFDYIICSHVLEHVPADELPQLIAEIDRVGKKKYIEFPTSIYDYVYDFNVHENFMDIVNGEIICLPKASSNLHLMKPFTDFNMYLRKTQNMGIEGKYLSLFGVGQEFDNTIPYKMVNCVEEFFNIVSPKYKERRKDSTPDLLFLFTNKIKKIWRGIQKEKEQSDFASVLQ